MFVNLDKTVIRFSSLNYGYCFIKYLNLAPKPFKSSASCLKVDGLPIVDRYVVLDDQSSN